MKREFSFGGSLNCFKIGYFLITKDNRHYTAITGEYFYRHKKEGTVYVNESQFHFLCVDEIMYEMTIHNSLTGHLLYYWKFGSKEQLITYNRWPEGIITVKKGGN